MHAFGGRLRDTDVKHNSFTRDVKHNSFTRVPWRIYTCAVTYSHVCRVAFTCVPWPIDTCNGRLRDTKMYCHWARVPWLIHTCGVTYSHLCRDLFTRVPWLIHTCAKDVLSLGKCAVTHSHEWCDLFTRVPWLIATFVWCMHTYCNLVSVPWLIHMCAVMHRWILKVGLTNS